LNISKIIKDRASIRKYKTQNIPQDILMEIIEAGRWGPSLHGFQPQKFLVIRNGQIIRNVSSAILVKSTEIHVGYNILMRTAAETIKNSNVLIVICNTEIVQKKMGKIGPEYYECARLSEIESISASIQNMILVAEDNQIGSCWLALPIFCKASIEKVLDIEHMIAMLTLGYPDEKGSRAKRKDIKDSVVFVD